MNLVRSVKMFLEKHHDGKSPILLGFSGGPDSTALLHLLLKCKKKIPLHLAHIDHNWRKTSSLEAKKLCEKAKELGLAFHCHRLTEKVKSNIEEHAREKRLEFFQKVAKENGCAALLLAHQADDLAETVLKRVLEGAALSKLIGMKSISCFKELAIWRPLLGILKKDLIRFLRNEQIDFIKDSTNEDKTFLRARMRREILPDLEKSFGKNIRNNLLKLSSRSNDLGKYLDNKCQQALNGLKIGNFGSYIDLKGIKAFHRLEKKHLLNLILQKLRLNISDKDKDKIIDWIEMDKTDKRIDLKDTSIILDRNILFFLKYTKSFNPLSYKLEEGKNKVGPWTISITSSDYCEKWSNWSCLWENQSTIFVPKGVYHVKYPNADMSYKNVSVKKWFANQKVPAFLRPLVPVIVKEDTVVGEFLTGRQKMDISDVKEFFKISIELET